MLPATVGAFRFATLSPGDKVSTLPFFEPRNLRGKLSQRPQSCISSNSPFDIVGELLMRRSHISFPDFHCFHKHLTQSFQILYRHLKNFSLSPLFLLFVCPTRPNSPNFILFPVRCLPLSCHLCRH